MPDSTISRPHHAIPSTLQVFSGKGGGIESWLDESTPPDVLEKIMDLDNQPISFEHLNQLLILSHEAGLSRGFFKYYWLTVPPSEGSTSHPYDVSTLEHFDSHFSDTDGQIISVRHLAWGLERLYTDGLLFFGNIRECYRQLRNKDFKQLQDFFVSKCFDVASFGNRRSTFPLNSIPKEDRYLIAEVACKTYDAPEFEQFVEFLLNKYDSLKNTGRQRITSRDLLGLPQEDQIEDEPESTPQLPLPASNAKFSLDEILDVEIESREELENKMKELAEKFFSARSKALKNTELYLSMVYDLDAYVATSMRTRDDFRNMANQCENIFDSKALEHYKLRYFDPTLSAAQSHEDKGLIECLMVKCAKVLIYMAGTRETYGKDAEAAMALSLGKPVIFLCDKDTDVTKFRDVHPLSRLIDFQSGVAVGAIVAENITQVPILLDRILSNKMQYKLEKKRNSYLLLKEKLTNSIVRIQTDDMLLRETFWNYYHSQSTNNSHT